MKPPIKKVAAPKKTAYQTVMKIRQAMRHMTLEWTPMSWLDTGEPELNEVLGARDRGIPYGRILEISGMESGGKTALAMHLAGIAQKDGAYVIWIDFEVSFDPEWAVVRGLLPENVYLIQPYVGTFGKSKTPALATAEVLCGEAEELMHTIHAEDPKARIIVVTDSIASMLVAAEAEAGRAGQNLRTNMALPKFLGNLLRTWVGMAQAYSAIMIFINQLRENPMQMFGDPLYTPGGNAPRFYAHIRVRTRRAKGGRILKAGKQVGIQGVLANLKNKAGGVERATVGYKIYFDGRIKFLPAIEITKEGDE